MLALTAFTSCPRTWNRDRVAADSPSSCSPAYLSTVSPLEAPARMVGWGGRYFTVPVRYGRSLCYTYTTLGTRHLEAWTDSANFHWRIFARAYCLEHPAANKHDCLASAIRFFCCPMPGCYLICGVTSQSISNIPRLRPSLRDTRAGCG